MKKVDIYYSRVCSTCTEAIHYFHTRGASFSAHAVEWDEQAESFVDSENTREMYRRCGETVDFVPQIFIGDRHIGGWRKLEPLIESGEIDSIM
jgi:glutaredoxin 3